MQDREGDIWPIAEEAAAMVEDGMAVGLGTGRAASMFVRALAARVSDGLRISAIATSKRTAELAASLSLPTAGFDVLEELDLDVDGADEVDPALNLIKGHGGALLRERVVASVSKRFVILVGEDKLVPRLGAKKSVPVEVVPFAAPVVERALARMGASVELRLAEGRPFESDNGNHILDAAFPRIGDVAALRSDIDAIPGVVDNGLFVQMADRVLVQADGEIRRLDRS